MTFRYDDRVKVSIASNLGAANPIPYNSPALTGYLPFTSITGITTADVVPYAIWDGAGNWEEGYGTWTNGTGLARPSTVSRNSAGTTVRINFTNPTTAWCAAFSKAIVLLDGSGNAAFPGALSCGNLTAAGGNFSGGVTTTSFHASANSQIDGDENVTGGFTASHIASGNEVTATGFGIVMEMSFAGISSNGVSGSNIDCIAQGSGGVRLQGGDTSWTSLSDETLKTPFVPFVGALAKVAGIKSGTGRYLTDEAGVSRSFLSAQSVQLVLPEAVKMRTAPEGENDPMVGKLMLSYTDVIPLLVAALKEAEARIVALEARG